jgi:hypothetical protein
MGRFPLLAGLGFVTSLAMLSQFDSTTATFGLFTIIAGIAAYVILKKYLPSGEEKERAE